MSVRLRGRATGMLFSYGVACREIACTQPHLAVGECAANALLSACGVGHIPSGVSGAASFDSRSAISASRPSATC
jgi:hypothetical protein